MPTALWIINLLIGFVLAIPYNFLAAGSPESMVFLMIVLPFAAFSLATARLMKFGKGYHTFFWSLVFFILLPIFMNGMSILLYYLNFDQVAYWFFTLRFASWFILIVLFVIYGYVSEWLGNHSIKRAISA